MINPHADWDLYRSFLAVLRAGSLSGAGRTLGLAQPTIGRHIATLEHSLGLTLFTRSLHGLIPTEAALALRADAQAMEAAAAALQRSASGHGRDNWRGTVRLTASEVIGAEVLPPILGRLLHEHPGLQVELALSNHVEDLLRRDADIAVRMLRPTQGPLVARRIGTVGLGLYGHPRYLARFGTPSTIAELARHVVIGYDRETAFIRELRAQGIPLDRLMFTLRTDNDLAALAALRAGCGLSICQHPLAAGWQLLPVLPGLLQFSLPVWLAMHGDLRGSRRFRISFDALADGLTDYLASSAWPPASADA